MSNKNITCPKCGASLSGESLFCNFCGTAITDVTDILKEKAHLEIQQKKTEDALRFSQQVDRESRKMVIMLIVLAAVMGLIFLIPFTIILLKS